MNLQIVLKLFNPTEKEQHSHHLTYRQRNEAKNKISNHCGGNREGVRKKLQKTKGDKNLGELMLKGNSVIYQIKYLC